jgi:hypothetical protein
MTRRTWKWCAGSCLLLRRSKPSAADGTIAACGLAATCQAKSGNRFPCSGYSPMNPARAADFGRSIPVGWIGLHATSAAPPRVSVRMLCVKVAEQVQDGRLLVCWYGVGVGGHARFQIMITTRTNSDARWVRRVPGSHAAPSLKGGQFAVGRNQFHPFETATGMHSSMTVSAAKSCTVI